MKIPALIFGKIEAVSGRLKKRFLRKIDSKFNSVELWYKDDPYGLKRSSFDFLNENSTVIDLGGYKGDWTSDLYSRYNCSIHIFEPVKAFAEIIQLRFKKNLKIKVYQAGLAEADGNAIISLDEFASKITIEKELGNTERIELKEFNSFLSETGIQKIDLIKINIEGAEYELLNHLINTGTIDKIKVLLIQFHDFIPDAESKRESIRQALNITHKIIFDYPFVWECWERKFN